MKKLRLPPKYPNKENLNNIELSMLKYYEDWAAVQDPLVILVFDHGTDFEAQE